MNSWLRACLRLKYTSHLSTFNNSYTKIDINEILNFLWNYLLRYFVDQYTQLYEQSMFI